MPVCIIVKLLPLGTKDNLMHYCTRPKAKCNCASGLSRAPRGNNFDYTRGDQKVRGKGLSNRIAFIDCNENS